MEWLIVPSVLLYYGFSLWYLFICEEEEKEASRLRRRYGRGVTDPDAIPDIVLIEDDRIAERWHTPTDDEGWHIPIRRWSKRSRIDWKKEGF